MEQTLEMDLQKFGTGGLLSRDTTLSYKASGSTFTAIDGLQSVPETGGDPEKVDVTTLADAKKQYISGLQDTETLEFGMLYRGTNFTQLLALQTAGKPVEFQIEWPDKSKTNFTGEVTVKRGGAEVNGALTFTLSIVVSDGPTHVPAA